VLIFDTFEDSEHHKDAQSKLDALERWIIPSIVFHEYMWFMNAEKIELDFAKGKINEYLLSAKTTYSPIESSDILFASETMTGHREYNDLLILSVSRRLRRPLFTYDGQLKRKCERFSIKTIQ